MNIINFKGGLCVTPNNPPWVWAFPGCVLQPEGPAEEIPESEGSDDGCLGDVCRCDGSLVVATNQIYHGNIFLPGRLPLKSFMWGKG